MVQGVGEHVLTVRFETRATGQPGRVKNFPVTTDELRVCDPLESLDWDLSRVVGEGGDAGDHGDEGNDGGEG